MIIRSISGVRGIVATHLTPDTIQAYARAFHTHVEPGLVFLGRDSRPSGEDILDAFTAELIRLGRDVIVCGIVPTPTVQFMVERSEAAGGVIITASHNPIEWNGLKFVRSDGTFFHPAECETLFNSVDKDTPLEDGEQAGMFFPDQNSILKHSIGTVELSCIELNAIRKRKFKVVIDAVNGAGSEALPLLLEHLGCVVVSIHCEGNGEFNRGTEPLPENLGDLRQVVIDNNADVGFAVDPDADRLAIVNEAGEPLGEEYTLVLAVEGYIKKKQSKETFVTNLSTSLALEKMAKKYGCSVERAAVGEINVVQKMLEVGAELGGEGNGGVILKEAHLGRDSLVGAAMVLNRMAQSKKSLSAIHESLPQFEIVKNKINLEGIDLEKLIKDVSNLFNDAEVNTFDGVKFTWEDRWVHLRKSNTEPIMRIYAEAPNKNDAEKLVQKIQSCI
ncbi:MAG: phosphoglucosamine mutase [Candidatus Marinimicrobia bacterium]|jgi:phosphomannomutase|nr:phosphoglucosamine mutase [Candidatus Neomarinimicrobiota bacterium]MDP6611479.1 phosphoglucosamine mutase [Candidatus Neomarinimicrobiota bacterium]|tara:strand:+ start:1953 stop:3290 length:1338 start_codon:yes stop_codon:yes gene_type:complete